MESDSGAVGAGNEKIPYRDNGVMGEGAAKTTRSMTTFMVITVAYRRATNADDA